MGCLVACDVHNTYVMDYSMVQSVFDEHKCMFINSHYYSVVPWVSMMFHTSKSYFLIISASMSDIRIMEWTVLTQFGYGLFIGVISF